MKKVSEVLLAEWQAMAWPAGKVLHVCGTNGSDTKGLRGSPRAYKTLTAAKTAAVSGDTIIVYPGTYDEFNLAKNGVNWHFLNGAKIVRTNAALSTVALFDDNGANVAFEVTGEGEFTSTSAPVIKLSNGIGVFNVNCRKIAATGSKAIVIELTGLGPNTIRCQKISNTGAFTCVELGAGDNASVNIFAEEISSAASVAIDLIENLDTLINCPVITGIGTAVQFANGTVTILNAIIRGSSIGVALNTGAGELKLVSCKIATTTASNPAINVIANSALVLKSCTVLAGASASFSIAGTSTPSVRMYGGNETNKAVSGITQLVGTILVSANVT